MKTPRQYDMLCREVYQNPGLKQLHTDAEEQRSVVTDAEDLWLQIQKSTDLWLQMHKSKDANCEVDA